MRWVGIAGAVIAAIIAAFWWLLIEGSAPASGAGDLVAQDMRAPVAADSASERPVDVRVEIIGTDRATGFAAQTGAFGEDYDVAYTAFQIVWADGRSLVIGGAVDQAIAAGMQRSPEHGSFDEAAYERLTDSMLLAESVLVTHGHSDHVVAIARHPQPDVIAQRLQLTQNQKDMMARFGPGGKLPPAIEAAEPLAVEASTRIAPGVVLIPNPGHTPTSQSVYVHLSDGREVLLVGDIVWKYSNIDALTTRPRLLQYVLFDPPEDRHIVLAQVRDLYELKSQHPEIAIVPSHDAEHLDDLIEREILTLGFVAARSPATSD